MRHRRKTVKLKRSAPHRRSLMSNQATAVIQHGRIRTTLGKAKAMRPVVEKLVTLAKRNDLHSRRVANSFLNNETMVKRLFDVVAPACADRKGGYCRIVKLGPRTSDSAPMAYLEWVDYDVITGSSEKEEAEADGCFCFCCC